MKNTKQEKKQEEELNEKVDENVLPDKYAQLDDGTRIKTQHLEALVELPNTKYWEPICELARARDMLIYSLLLTFDAEKQQTEISRTQGARGGTYYLENIVLNEIERRKKSEKNLEEGKSAEPNKPNYNNF